MKRRKRIILITVIFIITMILSIKEESTASTIGQIEEEDIYYLDVSHENLYHGNIKQFFSPYKTTILRIYPYISLSIKDDKIEKELSVFYFYNADTLYRQYSSILKKYALHNELEKIEIKGIPIKIAVVTSSRQDIISLHKNYPNIKIIDEYPK